jgi:polysaccharide export outer membrane protein
VKQPDRRICHDPVFLHPDTILFQGGGGFFRFMKNGYLCFGLTAGKPLVYKIFQYLRVNPDGFSQDSLINKIDMKKISGFSSFYLLFTALIIVFLSSCVTQKQVKYLQKKQKEDTVQSFKNRKVSDYRIQPHDNLYIRIFAMDEKSYFFFNKQSAIGGSSTSESSELGLYLDSYVVNDSGYIYFPLLGKLFIKDLKVSQAKNLIQSLVNEYLNDVTVTVKLVNFTITLLGEVKKPGKFQVYQDKINIFEAISVAGDLTDFANRGKVALVRQTKEGSRVIYLDLNSIDILHSDYYFLEPNDIVYFAPLGIKRWGTETFPWALLFGIISTTLLLITFFK